MKIAVIGGGPAGLYFALLVKRRFPGHEVAVFEQNPRAATYGWGVVFSTISFLDGLDARFFKSADYMEFIHRGEAVKLEQDAEAYKQEIVARSQGEAQRFVSVYDSYKVAPDVTSKRLYLETMEEVLKGTQKVIIDRAAEGGSGVIPYLPLPELRRGPAQGASAPRAQQPGFTPAPQPPAPGGQTQRGAARP